MLYPSFEIEKCRGFFFFSFHIHRPDVSKRNESDKQLVFKIYYLHSKIEVNPVYVNAAIHPATALALERFAHHTIIINAKNASSSAIYFKDALFRFTEGCRFELTTHQTTPKKKFTLL